MLKKVINKDGQEIYVCDLTQIKKEDAPYNILMSGRSDGKSFAVLEEILNNKLKYDQEGAIIRRWDTDFKRGRAAKMWTNLVHEGKLEGTEWDSIQFKSGAWYLAKFDKKTRTFVYDKDPLCHAMAMSDIEHSKSTSYPKVTTVLFDEFIPMGSYYPNEFVTFMNILSTIIRKYRRDVKIYMCANTITNDSIYFKEMGLKRVDKLEPGTIQVYKYGDSDMKVALEIMPPVPNTDETNSSYYFAFDNPQLAMIRGEGFQLAMYPHLPTWCNIRPKDIRKIFFIWYNDEIIQGELCYLDSNIRFLYFHKKTTPIQDEDTDIIYSDDPDPRRNWRINIFNPTDKLGKAINEFFKRDKVFYQDNEVGENVNNYLKFCRSYSIIK